MRGFPITFSDLNRGTAAHAAAWVPVFAGNAGARGLPALGGFPAGKSPSWECWQLAQRAAALHTGRATQRHAHRHANQLEQQRRFQSRPCTCTFRRGTASPRAGTNHPAGQLRRSAARLGANPGGCTGRPVRRQCGHRIGHGGARAAPADPPKRLERARFARRGGLAVSARPNACGQLAHGAGVWRGVGPQWWWPRQRGAWAWPCALVRPSRAWPKPPARRPWAFPRLAHPRPRRHWLQANSVQRTQARPKPSRDRPEPPAG